MLDSISIKAKVLLFSLGGVFLLSIIVGTISVYSSKNALINKSYGSLTSSRDIKKSEIESFFHERVSDIHVMTKSKNVKDLIEDLVYVHEQLKVKGSEDYPVRHHMSQEKTVPHEEFFQNYVKEYGYYDMFIICAKHGHVMYSQAKKSDYGANVGVGSLKDSGLGEVWRKVKESKEVVYVDMKPYTPRNNDPAMFLGAPVYLDGKFKAVLVFQISDKSINRIMQFREGYGKSQEDFLIGPDRLMRSDSFLDPVGHSIKASFANNAKIETAASLNALSGKTNTELITDYNGHSVLAAYTPLKVGDDLTWAIVSEIDEEEVLHEPNILRNEIIISALIVMLILSVIIYTVITKTIVNKLKSFESGLLNFFKFLNKETSNAKPLEVKGSDEIAIMSKVVNENIVKTEKLIQDDNLLIDEVKQVVGKVNEGLFKQTINKSTSNQSLNELKDLLNQMLEILTANVCGNLNKIQDALDHYQKLNFTHRIPDCTGKTGQGLNKLADIINEMLVDNKQNGLTLQDSSNTLFANVESLSSASNEAAASLEETAAALEEITSNITNNTENVVKMSNYANELSNSANEGEKLANETTLSMDQINEQVNAINEAISVIDQIAFQTNILSLNAAVEAATAGEAGKGFAVVAGEVRNLAARSAEAASEIKLIVENATAKANNGKTIADKMIEGYHGLNENVQKTLDLIKDVEMASKEQQSGIVQINDAVNELDQQTQANASVANQTRDIAVQTQTIADDVVANADAKEFIGKNDVKAKSVNKTEQNTKRQLNNNTNIKIKSDSSIISHKNNQDE